MRESVLQQVMVVGDGAAAAVVVGVAAAAAVAADVAVGVISTSELIELENAKKNGRRSGRRR